MTDFWRGRLLTVLLLAVFLGACGDGEQTEEGGESDGESQRATPVETATATIETVDVIETSVGTVETFSHPRVAAEVGGRVVAAEADVGDEVEKGDVLARIEPEPYRIARDVARAEVGRLEAMVDRLELDLERARRLSQREYASEQDTDAVAAELESAREQLNSARSRLEQAERDLRLTDIVAPMAGIVDERMISEGSFVSAGEPSFWIQPRDRYRARLSFPEYVGSRLQHDMEVRLRPRDPGLESLTGRISRIRPAVDDSTRALEALVEFENPGNWRNGMTVEARVVIERRENAVRVPQLSVVRRPVGDVVYVVDGETVVEQPVTVGRRTTEWMEIREGLDGDETVVTEGATYLTDGAPIQIREDG